MEEDIFEEPKEQEEPKKEKGAGRKRKVTRRKTVKKKVARRKAARRRVAAKKSKGVKKKTVQEEVARPKKRNVRKKVGKWYDTYRRRKELGTLPRGVIKVEPSSPPKNSFLDKLEKTLVRKLAHWTGIHYFHLRFLVSRSRYSKRYVMMTNRENIAMNKRRGYQAELWAVYMCQSFGFDARRVPLSGSGGMRGDVLIKLPTGGQILAEVKFSTQFTSGNEKCIRFLSEWFEKLEENVQAMSVYNVIGGLFFFKYGLTGVYFTAIFKDDLNKIGEHIGSKFSEYIHPYQQVPFIDTLKPVDTEGKTLTIRASVALRGVVFFHTDAKTGKDREIYVFPAEFLLDWAEQSLKRRGVWYEVSPVIKRSPRRQYKRVAVPPSILEKVAEETNGSGTEETETIDRRTTDLSDIDEQIGRGDDEQSDDDGADDGE